MPVELRDLLNIVAEICDEQKLQVCFSETLKGTAYTAAAAAICGLLMGPVGFGVGGTIGGLAATVLTKGKFQPASTILKNLDATKKQKLYDRFQYAFRNFGAPDIAAIALMVTSKTDFKELVVTIVKNFLTTDMMATVQSAY